MAYALWLVNFYDDIHILCISKSQDKAYELIAKVKFMYSRLPAHLRKKTIKWNEGAIVFKSDHAIDGDEGEEAEGSWIRAIPSTPGAAVGYTATLVICDEWAEQEYAEELFTAYKPTIDMGGRFIGISTGNAVGSFYHEVWSKARMGENGFLPIFLPFNYRPGRDEEWYQRTKRSYPSEKEFYRQYPRNEVEAFLAAGGCPFDHEDIEWYIQNFVRAPLTADELARVELAEVLRNLLHYDELQFWKLPEYKSYVVSFDPATGQEGKDYNAIEVLDMHSLEQVAELRTRCDLDIACEAFYQLALMYGHALMVWERTGIGHAVTNFVVRKGAENLYEHEDVEDERRKNKRREQGKTTTEQSKLGWPATTATCHARDADLIAVFREHDIILHSKRWLDEGQAFVKQSDGRFRATGRAHDDLVTCFGQGIWVALRRLNRKPANTRRTRSYKPARKTREHWR